MIDTYLLLRFYECGQHLCEIGGSLSVLSVLLDAIDRLDVVLASQLQCCETHEGQYMLMLINCCNVQSCERPESA